MSFEILVSWAIEKLPEVLLYVLWNQENNKIEVQTVLLDTLYLFTFLLWLAGPSVV